MTNTTPQDALAAALLKVAGSDASVFVYGGGDEPEGDVYIGSSRFAELVLAAMPARLTTDLERCHCGHLNASCTREPLRGAS